MHLRIVLTLKLLNSKKMKDAHSFTPSLSASRFQLTSHKMHFIVVNNLLELNWNQILNFKQLEEMKYSKLKS